MDVVPPVTTPMHYGHGKRVFRFSVGGFVATQGHITTQWVCIPNYLFKIASTTPS